MAQAKNIPTQASVADFLASVESERKREEGRIIEAMLRRVSGVDPSMWGPSIVGYGSYHYRYESGREGDMWRVGFSPRKTKHSLYLMHCGDEDDQAAFAPLLAKLGKHSRGKACLYINKLADVDLNVLEDMARLSWERSFEHYPQG